MIQWSAQVYARNQGTVRLQDTQFMYNVYVMVNVEGIFHHCTVLQRGLI